MIGRRLSHYRVLAPIASGGMGEVYRARDEPLERDVALEVLPHDLLADEPARRRFRREAQALSDLQHPHIAIVHDFDEQDGVAFMVMELITGETLQRRLEHGPLTEAEVRRIGAQIAGALAAAHESGVIHRDLKPGSVMLTARGNVKILDFGISRRLPTGTEVAVTTLVTEPAALVGTLPYMSPEQLLGHPVDARTNVFALGAVLYELATGRRPFAGDTPMALANAILNHTPMSPREVRRELTESLSSLITRCLEKRPDGRFASAAAVEMALADAAVAPQPRAGGRRPVVPLVAAAIVLVLAGGFLVQRLGRQSPGAGTIQALAVLPLENLSSDPDQEYCADGMTDELIVNLSQVAALEVISRSSTMSYKRTAKPARQIGRELNVDAVVTGSVQHDGNRVRIRAQLVNATTDQGMWAERFEDELSDALTLQRRLARTIVERIDVRLRPRESARLAVARPVDPEAHELYLRGRFLWNTFTTEGWRRSIVKFQESIRRDSSYAPAYVGLADAYELLSSVDMPPAEAMALARTAAERALQLDPDLAAAYASRGYVQANYDYDWRRSEANYRHALDLDPHAPTALQNYGFLLHVNGRFDEARRLFARTKEVDPLSASVSTMTLWPLVQGRHYEQAIAAARDLIAADSTTWYPRLLLAQALAFSGRHEEAGLNYLCAGYKEFYTHIDRPMKTMAGLIRAGRYADEIMQG